MRSLPFSFILILFMVYSSYVLTVGDDLYLNPWSNIDKNELKIIQFNMHGAINMKEMKNNNLLTIKSTIQAIKGKRRNTTKGNDNKKLDWNATYFINELRGFVDTMYASVKGPKKLKILTTCNKSRSACRFLTCPDIKTHCILCEAQLRKIPDPNSTTNCEEYDTRFLI